MTTDSWNKRYAETKNLFGASPNPFLVSHQHYFKPGMAALAIGDGEAHNGIWLAQQVLQVTSVDTSEVAQEKAKSNAQKAGVKIDFICSDILDYLTMENAFDVIVHFFVHLPPPQRQTLHAKMIRALKVNGYILFECFHKTQLQYECGGPKDINMLYDEAEIEKEFSELKIETLEKYRSDVYEETRGHSPGVSLRFVGVKL